MTSPKTVRLGMLTPSSNTVLEPLTFEMASSAPHITAHFSRFRVTQIGLSVAALDQFEAGGILAAAELLADANVDVIAWNGTSAAWLGFDRDEALCEMITSRTGIAACTAVLAFRELFETNGLKRIGLVTPYTGDVQTKIMSNWDAAGFRCTAERHLGLSNNFSFAEVGDLVLADLGEREVVAEVGEDQIADMTRDVAREGCDAVAIVCTNLKGAALAPQLERELGMPVLDSISVTFWKSMALAGRRPADLSDWGGPFSLAGELSREEA